MVPRNTRSYLPILFALCALITLSMLVLCLPLVANVSTAIAAPVDAAQGATLAVSTTNLSNCQQCTVNVINQSPNRPLNWSASNHGIPGVTFNPPSGKLPSHQQITVNISFPSNVGCPANDTITFNGPSNSVNVYWNCSPTPTPTPSPTPITPTPTPTPSPTPLASPTPDTSLTPTVTSTPIGGIAQQNNGGNPPADTGGSTGSAGSSALSILLSVGALLLGLFAFTLYLIPPANSSVRTRLLALILPVSFLKRPPPQS